MHYEKNVGISPNKFKLHSGRKVWWICSAGHEWKAAISDRSRGDGCPFCSGKRILVRFNDLAHIYPHLAKEWNYEKNNGKLPENVTAKAGVKVWWKCKKGHEWEAIIANRTRRGDSCPYCG